MRHIVTAIAALLFSLQVHAVGWEENAGVAALFKEAGVNGTFVLYDIGAGRLIGHDQVRANTRYVPASTFKIANTLIGLAVGAVGSVDEVLPYGGAAQPFRNWERDMSLRDAIAMSNVAIYRELARRIGLERMRAGVQRLHYGNQMIGSVVDQFWLLGPLSISAVEQTRFLAQLASGALPFSSTVQDDTRAIIHLEDRDGAALYGKTGWENAPGAGVGWWVGWVRKDDRVYAFALNIDIRQPADAEQRIALGKASLRALGVL